jgi:4-diphosphocytidyl-2-C-methyl-D-erythritol kinase
MSGTIREFAPAKVNLALHVLGRRADGYHELDSIVAFAGVGDWLEVGPCREASAAPVTMQVAGSFATQLPPSTDNIVARAHGAVAGWALEMGLTLSPVRVALDKNLPVSSGIGGGSADAAAMLRACFKLLGKSPAPDEATELALALGADVPVCLTGKASRMRGVGERLTPLPAFKPLHAVLVNPGVAVPTAEIFRAMGIAQGATHRAAITESQSIATWRNDMMDAAIAIAPGIAIVLHELNRQPSIITARMSGSGATCFGIFETATAAQEAAKVISAAQPAWWCVATLLQ